MLKATKDSRVFLHIFFLVAYVPLVSAPRSSTSAKHLR